MSTSIPNHPAHQWLPCKLSKQSLQPTEHTSWQCKSILKIMQWLPWNHWNWCWGHGETRDWACASLSGPQRDSYDAWLLEPQHEFLLEPWCRHWPAPHVCPPKPAMPLLWLKSASSAEMVLCYPGQVHIMLISVPNLATSMELQLCGNQRIHAITWPSSLF